jgi:putative flavoprotein involved in K+ transport
MATTTSIDVAIIGAGQAGLAVSHELATQGRDHVVFERARRLAEPWRSERWDSFTLVTPNWAFRLPGARYQGDDPDGYLPRDEVVRTFEAYAASFGAPVVFDTEVQAVDVEPGGSFILRTNGGTVKARDVVIATSLFQRPKVPAVAAGMPAAITQLHSRNYRRPEALPPGAALVVGTAQSGAQIAEELYQHGRTVYLSVGGAGRAPRRYRGRDVFGWLLEIGFFNQPIDPAFAAPHVSGKNGGRTLNLHEFARHGVRLLGHVRAIDDGMLRLAPDLHENLAKADGFDAHARQMIDGFIAQAGIDAPPAESDPPLRDGFALPQHERLDLAAADITSVIWATGYQWDFSWIHAPVFDGNGLPVVHDGGTATPGLHFAGFSNLGAHTLAKIGDDAIRVATAIAAPDRSAGPDATLTRAAD